MTPLPILQDIVRSICFDLPPISSDGFYHLKAFNFNIFQREYVITDEEMSVDWRSTVLNQLPQLLAEHIKALCNTIEPSLRDDLQNELILAFYEGANKQEMTRHAKTIKASLYRASSFSKYNIALNKPAFDDSETTELDRFIPSSNY